jgi:hypothetical protein
MRILKSRAEQSDRDRVSLTGKVERTPCLTAVWIVILGCSMSGCYDPSPDSRSLEEYGIHVVPQSEWSEAASGGYAGSGIRRNLAKRDTVSWRGLAVTVEDVKPGRAASDSVLLTVREGGASDQTGWIREDSRFEVGSFQIAVLAVRTDSAELGFPLTEIEMLDRASVPDSVLTMDVAGSASHRLRVPHEIRSLVLHHSGDAEPLRPDDDVVGKLRRLQSWSRTDRNWWDLPYHYLVDLDGRIYEGRDHHFAGDTNTRYDPRGHLLISVMGNYNLQEPTRAQVDALSRFFAWAMSELEVPADSIRGHADVADTSCPGEGLRRYLRDGTLVGRAHAIAETL